MSGALAGLLLVVGGAILGAPALVAVGVMVLLVWALRTLWTRYGLSSVTYERRLNASRVLVGERMELELTVRNRKFLPLPWLEVQDYVSEGTQFAGRQLEPAEQPGFAVLRTTWTLGWFQRATRTLHIEAERRGVYDFTTVKLRVADLFDRDSVESSSEQRLHFKVVPRLVPVRATAPLSELPGAAPVHRGLFEDPALFAGVRPYQPGDQLRRVHWKATARTGRPVSRRFDPVQERDVMIALDAQTIAGAFWVMHFDDDLIEGLCVAAMSLARSLVAHGVECGLAVNAYASKSESRWVYLAPSSSPRQIERIADQLADITRWASLPFATLLHQLASRVPPTTSIVALSGREPDDFLDVLRRLGASGRDVRLAAHGRHANVALARARALGVSASNARLEPDWRTASALELVG
jgi:uncharacterized protein (DUF58 family)